MQIRRRVGILALRHDLAWALRWGNGRSQDLTSGSQRHQPGLPLLASGNSFVKGIGWEVMEAISGLPVLDIKTGSPTQEEAAPHPAW